MLSPSCSKKVEAADVPTATYKAEIHALHPETANVTEKSELRPTLSAKMRREERAQDQLLKQSRATCSTLLAAGPCSSPLWIVDDTE